MLHYLELLRDKVGFDRVKEAVVKSRSQGRKVAAYYGCMLLRPAKVMQMDDPENPQIMEDFIRALGAEPVVWSDTQRMLRRLYRAGERRIRAQKEPQGARKREELRRGSGCNRVPALPL